MGRDAVPGTANKEKQKMVEKGLTMEMVEPVEERPERAGGTTGEKPAGTEEMVEVEVPLVRKKRRLIKTGQAEPVQERSTAEATGLGGDGVEQATYGPSGREGTANVGKEGHAALPLVLVPFEAVPEEEQRVRMKQAARRQEVRTVAQDVLCAAPGRLGYIELTRGEASSTRTRYSGEEVSDGRTYQSGHM